MFLRSRTTGLAIIALTGLLVYSNTFRAPFQWDDNHFISENPIVKDIGYFIGPSRAEGLELYGAFKGRYIGYLSFALNYSLHGLDVTGYHVFNIGIHIADAFLVYLLVLLLLRTPFLARSSLSGQDRSIAFFASIFFVSHPVQTEAVTYVFQRLASLAAFFYISSVVLYVKWRLKIEQQIPPLSIGSTLLGKLSLYSPVALYFLSLLSAVLAMKTKENAFTLPVIIALAELMLFEGPLTRRLTMLFPFILTMLIIPLSLTGVEKPVGEVIGSIGPASRGFEQFARDDYLFTQFRVIVTYIRLVFFPVGQNIDYDYDLLTSFSNPNVWASFLFIASIFSLSLYLLYRSKRVPAMRLPAFGILWFFITLSVESSIIPIPMLIDEYRLYLPSTGAFISIISGLFLLSTRFKQAQKFLVPALVSIAIALSTACYARNGLWASEIGLWEDTVRKSPWKARTHNNLGIAYRDGEFNEKAEKAFKMAIGLRPDYSFAHYNLALLYKSTGRMDAAIEHFKAGLSYMPGDADAHNHLGTICGAKGMQEEAAKHYMEAIRLKPGFPEAHFNLGLYYLEKGLAADAEREFLTVLTLAPGDYDAQKFLHYIRGK